MTTGNVITGNGFIQGTILNDCITGSNGVDFIEALDGNDEIFARGSGDRINAGDGDDIVFGGEGDDTIDGQDDADILHGEEGTDEIAGGDGNDVLLGGSNSPSTPGFEDLNGEDGHDLLIGGAGNDRLVGGDDGNSSDPDNDTLVGTDYASAGLREIDHLRGGRGADRFVLGEVRTDVSKTPHREGELVNQSLRQKVYYVDDDITSTGLGDYAYIEDFRPAQGDKIQLLDPLTRGGSFGRVNTFYYTRGESPIPGIGDEAIYLNSIFSFIEPELIAIVRWGGRRNPERQLNFNSDYFDYVSDVLTLEPIPFPSFPITLG